MPNNGKHAKSAGWIFFFSNYICKTVEKNIKNRGEKKTVIQPTLYVYMEESAEKPTAMIK